jgi:hypothetical protein
VVSQIESQLTRLITPLQSIEISPGVGPGEAWKVSVRRTLLPQVQVAYSRELTGTADQEVNLRYNRRALYPNTDVRQMQMEPLRIATHPTGWLV